MDPDIFSPGEFRDGDEAAIVFQGAATGHLTLTTFNSFAKHPAYLWRDLQHFGDARSTFYAKVVAGRTAFSMKEGSSALSSCDRFFKIWSIWKNNLDQSFCNFTTARIGFTTSATEQRDEFL